MHLGQSLTLEAPTSRKHAGSNSSISYSDTDILLAVAGTGQGEMLIALASFDPNAMWQTRGNPPHQRKPVTFEITKVARNRALVGSTTNSFVKGTQFGDSPELIFGDPAKPNTDLSVSNLKSDPSTGVITADIKVAPDAVGGKVLIFVKSGSKITKTNNDAFF